MTWFTRLDIEVRSRYPDSFAAMFTSSLTHKKSWILKCYYSEELIALTVLRWNRTATYVLKALAGSTWGCGIETLLKTYQAIVRSILSYCCPVWTPSLKDTNWVRIQRALNYVLKITTGCHRMADVAELHQEVRELPVRQHNELISQQFSIACHQFCHKSPDDQPKRRRSLIGRSMPNIQQYLAEEPLINTSYKSAISSSD